MNLLNYYHQVRFHSFVIKRSLRIIKAISPPCLQTWSGSDAVRVHEGVSDQPLINILCTDARLELHHVGQKLETNTLTELAATDPDGFFPPNFF